MEWRAREPTRQTNIDRYQEHADSNDHFDISMYDLRSRYRAEEPDDEVSDFRLRRNHKTHIPMVRSCDGGIQYPPNEEARSQLIPPEQEFQTSRETVARLFVKAPFPWMLTMLATIPIILPTIVLLILIFRYRVLVEPSLFPDTRPSSASSAYVLVDFADTRLVLVASFLNNITGPLAGWIMALYAPKVARTLRLAAPDASVSLRLQPTPSEMTLLGGICQAAVWQHAKLHWFRLSKRFKKKRSRSAPALRQAANVLLLLHILQVMMFGAVTILHLTVDTISFDKIKPVEQNLYQPSFGLSSLCLHGDRISNYYPCSYNLSNPNLAEQLQTEFLLQHQSSNFANINFVEQTGSESVNMGILTPSPSSVPQHIDFRATSIGVTTDCSFITTSCHMHYMAELPNPDTYKTVFNCSSGFYGVLGEAPQLADGITTAGDPNVCPLCYKPAAILQLGYFMDPSLQMPDNSVGYDPLTLFPTPDPGPLPDAELVSEMYLALAGRLQLIVIDGNIAGNGDIFKGKHTYGELAMRCKLKAYNVEYSRVNGVFQNITSSETQNGTALEIFHGVQFYDQSKDGQLDIQEIWMQASLEPTTAAFRKKWEMLMSTKIMSVIGSVMNAQDALQQQSRETILVARVPWSALALLCLVTLMQVGLGAQIIISTYIKNEVDFRDGIGGEHLSTPGACWGAFQESATSLASLSIHPSKTGVQLEDVDAAEGLRVRVIEDDGQCCRLTLEKLPTEAGRL